MLVAFEMHKGSLYIGREICFCLGSISGAVYNLNVTENDLEVNSWEDSVQAIML